MTESASFWPLAVNTWGEEEREAAHRVIDSGQLTMGEQVVAFELEFARHVGSKHAVMVNSGSSANLLAVAVLRQFKGWSLSLHLEAIVPAIAWATTYAPLHQHGFRLRVHDCDPHTLNASPQMVAKMLPDPTTRLIVAASILGNPGPLEELRRLADAHGLLLLEDNCESLGATIRGRQCGTFGHIGTFSTFFSHHISTGEGGMLVTDNAEMYELALAMRAHGWTRNLPATSKLRSRPESPGDYQFIVPGYNLRPTELAAAVGRVQLGRLRGMNIARAINWQHFRSRFSEDPRWQIQRPVSSEHHAVPFGFTLVFKDGAARRAASTRLQAERIEHRMITGGCFTEHAAARHYQWFAPYGTGHASHAHHCGLFVGNHPTNLSEHIERLWEVLR